MKKAIERRVREATELGSAPLSANPLYRLKYLLDERSPAVVAAATHSLDQRLAANPKEITELVELVTCDLEEGFGTLHIPLARYLLARNSEPALEKALVAVNLEAGEEWREILDILAACKGLTDQRIGTLIRTDPRVAAEVLARRGDLRGWRMLMTTFATMTRVDEQIARGPEGIRIICQAAQAGPDVMDGLLVDRLIAKRKRTEPTLLELLEKPAEGGDRLAGLVLAHWDEPRIVESLMRAAVDPSRSQASRDWAAVALAGVEAPESADVLARVLLDPTYEPSTRARCAAALGGISETAYLGALRQALPKSQDPKLVRAIQDAIADLQELDGD